MSRTSTKLKRGRELFLIFGAWQAGRIARGEWPKEIILRCRLKSGPAPRCLIAAGDVQGDRAEGEVRCLP